MCVDVCVTSVASFPSLSTCPLFDRTSLVKPLPTYFACTLSDHCYLNFESANFATLHCKKRVVGSSDQPIE